MARCLLLVVLLLSAVVGAQVSDRAQNEATRVGERIRALEREAERLAGQARTLLVELRALEVERDLRIERAREAEAAGAAVQQQLRATANRLAALEQQRIAQLPDITAQLVDLYKRGRGGYLRLLLEARSLRDFARTARAVSALAAINERRLAEHRRTLAALVSERAALEQQSRELEARLADARQARAAAERAVRAHAALIARIDSRRDLTAQYVGELQVAHDQLLRQITELAAGRTAAPVRVPIAPFRGALDWPVAGRVAARFGQASGRLGGTAAQSGIEIAAPEGAVVRAVHGGTVGLAEPYVGFGRLVVVDHGGNDFTLYGYLGSISVQRGDQVEAGTELGRVGLAPAGPPGLYFELRIDGRSVDPLQWLRPR